MKLFRRHTGRAAAITHFSLPRLQKRLEHHDVRSRSRARARTRSQLRGGARARREGPRVRTVPADRRGEAAVPKREQRRGWKAGVQTVGSAERAGQGKRRTEPLPRTLIMFVCPVVKLHDTAVPL